jgi:uncharacterized phage-associated protein
MIYLIIFLTIILIIGIYFLTLPKESITEKLNKMYNCFDIADYFVKKAKEENEGIDPMKLLKLTYIAHGWYLGVTGKPLFENKVFAWKYGTVIPELYFAIRMFGSDSVDPYVFKLYSDKKIAEETRMFLDKIWNKYKQFKGLELSAKTHEEGTPWSKIWNVNKNGLIPNEIIKEHYKDKLKSA